MMVYPADTDSLMAYPANTDSLMAYPADTYSLMAYPADTQLTHVHEVTLSTAGSGLTGLTSSRSNIITSH